jgi:long-chain acyl-CoA synthetase
MIDYDSLRTLPSAFFDEARKRAAAPFLWSKAGGDWQAVTWGETATQVSALSRGLRELGIEVGDRVAIISENRPEWLIADLAIMAAGAISVPAYTTNTLEDHVHILADSGAKLAIVSTAKLAERVIPAAVLVPETEIVIIMDAVPADAQGARVIGWDDAMELGRAARDDTAERVAAMARADTCCIIYTSGTGGRPKRGDAEPWGNSVQLPGCL